jgi:protein-tyrosine-phosphatase
MAEAILKHLIANRPDSTEWRIASAGTWARSGAPAALFSQLVVQGMGADLSAHLSQPVTAELIENFDLILTMEDQQKEGLILAFPGQADRVFMLSEMVNRLENVPDPILGELGDYQAAANLMQRYLSGGLEKILQLASKHASEKST